MSPWDGGHDDAAVEQLEGLGGQPDIERAAGVVGRCGVKRLPHGHPKMSDRREASSRLITN